jgi:hypothetical protein
MDTKQFLPNAEMQADFQVFRNLKTKEEKADFLKRKSEEFNSKTSEEQALYKQSTKEGIIAIGNRVEELVEKVELGKVSNIVSISYIAQTYFGKTRHWLYQRLNGNLVNGKPARFTPSEKIRLKEALQDIGRIITNTSFEIA